MKCSGVCGFLAIDAFRPLPHGTGRICRDAFMAERMQQDDGIQKLEIIDDTNPNRSTGLTRRAEIR
jgi:hypothetical protein